MPDGVVKPPHHEILAPVLHALGGAQATGDALDPVDTARQPGVSVEELHRRAGAIEAFGLALTGFGGARPPLLAQAGRQYLARRGALADEAILRFLPFTLDNLDA